MQKSPTTDKALGIDTVADRFNKVRQRARDEYVMRGKRRKKDKTVLLPSHKVGEQIVVTGGILSDVYYHLIEVVDFEFDKLWKRFDYYGIMLKTTNKKFLDRIGRLIKTEHKTFYREYFIGGIPPSAIRWIEEEEKEDGKV
jgi:hypothetical protein